MSSLKALGGKLRRKSELSTVDSVLLFLQDLRDVSESLQAIIEEMETRYNEQVIHQRSFPSRLISKLPDQMKPPDKRLQDQRRSKIERISKKLKAIIESLANLDESIRCIENEEDEELLGRRIYELMYPNQPIQVARIDELNAKIDEFEASFLSSLENLNEKMGSISLTLSDFADSLVEQGVQLEKMNEKIEVCSTKLDEVQLKLIEISKKLTNRTLLAFVAGAAIGALTLAML
ncbi:MAG: hypothetical protein ACFFCQ_04515 [Promethearchaeota archaeon]